MSTYENINNADFVNSSTENDTENQYQTNYTSGQDWSGSPEENKVMGTLGALLGSLAGAAVYFLLNQAGFIASISGLAGTYCALSLYRRFAGKQSNYGIRISIIFCLLSIAASCYFSLIYDIFQAFKTEGITIWLCLRYGYKFLADSTLRIYFIKDLVMGLLFCILGISNALKRNARYGYY